MEGELREMGGGSKERMSFEGHCDSAPIRRTLKVGV